MTSSVFAPRLRAASIINRWSIVWTQRPDSVAAHSYYVALYAHMIAVIIQWTGPHDLLLQAALIHDLDELFLGDQVGVVKHQVQDARKSSDFVARKMQTMLPMIETMTETLADNSRANEINLIVKAADQLDSLFFVLTEIAMGNRIIGERLTSSLDRAHTAWLKLPSQGSRLILTWAEIIEPSIEAHKDVKNYDID